MVGRWNTLLSFKRRCKCSCRCYIIHRIPLGRLIGRLSIAPREWLMRVRDPTVFQILHSSSLFQIDRQTDRLYRYLRYTDEDIFQKSLFFQEGNSFRIVNSSSNFYIAQFSNVFSSAILAVFILITSPRYIAL